MRKFLSLIMFALALGITIAAGQTRNPTANAPAGDSGQAATAQSTTAPAQSITSMAGNSGAATAPANAAGTGSGGVDSAKTQATENPQSAAASTSDSELQTQIQQALNKEPTLSDDTVNVAVSGRSIDLSGRVGNARQKLTATRIVQSYAENRKVVDHLTIGNTSGNTAAATHPEEKSNEANPPGRSDLSSHPEPEKGSASGTSTRPPQ